MLTLNKFFHGKRSEEEVSFSDLYLKEAQEVECIVNNHIEKNSFSEINEQLDKLQSVKSRRVNYVFECSYSFTHLLMATIICAILTVCYLCYIFIYTGTRVYTNTFGVVAFRGIAISIIFLVINITVVIREFYHIRFYKRYSVYAKLLRFKGIELIDDLVEYSKVRMKIVIKDLNKAVNMKLIPQGHFSKDNLVFIVSDELYRKYNDKKVEYDKYYKKQVEERLGMKERTAEMEIIRNQILKAMDEIHIANHIKNKFISKKLVYIKNIVSIICYEIDINPQNTEKLGILSNLYLPIIEKLFKVYIDIELGKTKIDDLKMMEKDIEEVISRVINSFDSLLYMFYQEKEFDIEMQISSME